MGRDFFFALLAKKELFPLCVLTLAHFGGLVVTFSYFKNDPKNIIFFKSKKIQKKKIINIRKTKKNVEKSEYLKKFEKFNI